jgi:hypothetical protein
VLKKGRYEEMLKRKNIHPEIKWQTTISSFDIIYEHILPELELQEGSKLHLCNKNLSVFQKIFGFNDLKQV